MSQSSHRKRSLTRPRINAISSTGAIITKRTSQFRAILTTDVSAKARDREADANEVREEDGNREWMEERERGRGRGREGGRGSRSFTSANPISTRDIPHPPRGAEAALRR